MGFAHFAVRRALSVYRNMSEFGFDMAEMRAAVEKRSIEWQRHALERMVQRGIGREDVFNVLLCGDRIEDYPEDTPFPSALFFGSIEKRPLHVVAAYNAAHHTVYIITAYEPNSAHFEGDFRTRKRP